MRLRVAPSRARCSSRLASSRAVASCRFPWWWRNGSALKLMRSFDPDTTLMRRGCPAATRKRRAPPRSTSGRRRSLATSFIRRRSPMARPAQRTERGVLRVHICDLSTMMRRGCPAATRKRRASPRFTSGRRRSLATSFIFIRRHASVARSARRTEWSALLVRLCDLSTCLVCLHCRCALQSQDRR